MIRIIIGILLLLVSFSNVVTQGAKPGLEGAEGLGYRAMTFALFLLGVWLVSSGIRKRQKAAGKKTETAWQFLREFFKNPVLFLQKNAAESRPSKFFFVLWVTGMAMLLGKLDLWIFNTGMAPNWTMIWILALALGIIFGALNYWVLGSLFHLGVMICKGKKAYRASRNLKVYTGLPAYLALVTVAVANTVFYGNQFFSLPVNAVLDFILQFLAMAAAALTIYLGYQVALKVQETRPIPTLIVFVVIPAVIYLYLFTGFSFLTGRTEPPSFVIYNQRASEMMFKGDFNAAEGLYTLALKEVPEKDTASQANILQNLGMLYTLKGDPAKAKDFYTASLNFIAEGGSEYYSTLGILAILNDKTDEAIGHLKKAVELDETNSDAHKFLGEIYLGQHGDKYADPETALPYNKTAFELTEDITVTYSLALNYFSLGDFVNALPLLSTLEENLPGNPVVYSMLGQIYFASNDMETAKGYFKAVVELDPSMANQFSAEIKALLTKKE